jgi:hypothetical protein
MSRAFSTVGEKSNAYRILLGKLEGNRPVGILTLGGKITLKWFL